MEPRPPIERQTYSIKEATEVLGVSRHTVAKMIRAGDLVALRTGRVWKISKPALDAMLAGTTVTRWWK